MSGDRKLKGSQMLEAGFAALVEGAVGPAKSRALAAITAAAEAGKKRLLDKADSDGARVVDEKMAQLKAKSATFIDETFGGSTSMLREAVAVVMATAHRAETQAGVAAREAAAAQKAQRETVAAERTFMAKVLGVVAENRAADSARATKFEGTVLNRLREQGGKIAAVEATADRAEATADGANTVAVNANKNALEAKGSALRAEATSQQAKKTAENNATTLGKLGTELREMITTKADYVLAEANRRIDERLARVLRGRVARLEVDATGKVSVVNEYLEGEAFTTTLVRNGEATVAAAQMLLAANAALAKEARDLRSMNRTLEVELARLGHKPEVESRLLELERQVVEGILTGPAKPQDVAEMLVEIGGEKVKLGVLLANLKDALEIMQKRKAVDAEGAAAVETHEREARTSDPPKPEVLEAAKEAERNTVLGKLADALTDDRDSAVLKGLVAISNNHMDGIQSVLGVVGAEVGKLNESGALKEALGRLFAARNYRLDYDNMDSETAEKLAGKVSRAITLLERHLSHATTAEAETDATAVEREEEQFEQVKGKVDRFMEKFTELVVALNEQSIGDDEFGVRVTADPQMKRLEQLDAKLVQERLVKVAELIGEEVVAKVNGPLNLRTNGDLVASVESELRSRLQIIAEATSGVVSDAKIAEITGSW